MSESEATDSTVVNYREGDTPVPLPGLAIIGVKLLGLYALIQSVPQLVYLPILIWQGVLGPGSDWVRWVARLAVSSRSC